jgi:precorrin-2 dehydrogenase/sirohydrochlorin ferrochelatase
VIGGYPVVLRLSGRRCLVVGAGQVAARKVAALVRALADVHVVAPDAVLEIAALAESGALRWEHRTFEPADLDGAFLVVAATDSRAVNHTVAEAARSRRVLVNSVDDPDACDFTVPALVRRGDITLAISTGGRSPAFARYLREQLDDWLTDDRCTLLELLAELRRELRRAGQSVDPEVWRQAIGDAEALRSIAAGDCETARRRLCARLTAGQ